MKGIHYLDHLIMLFKVKIFVIKLLKCKINLKFICDTLTLKLTILLILRLSDFKEI